MRFRVQYAHLVASLILIELLYIGIRVADPFEGWAQQFFLHRTIIQWLTMALFSFCLVFLVSRLIACRSANRSLDAFEMSHPRQRRSSSYVFDRVLEAARAGREERGSSEERRRAWRDEDEEAIHSTHSTLMDLVQVMLGLGFLGTILGLNRTFFGSFSLGAQTLEGVTTSITAFSQGLYTALDTTTLALACGMTITVISLFIRSREDRVVERLDRRLSAVLEGASADILRAPPIRRGPLRRPQFSPVRENPAVHRFRFAESIMRVRVPGNGRRLPVRGR